MSADEFARNAAFDALLLDLYDDLSSVPPMLPPNADPLFTPSGSGTDFAVLADLDAFNPREVASELLPPVSSNGALRQEHRSGDSSPSFDLATRCTATTGNAGSGDDDGRGEHSGVTQHVTTTTKSKCSGGNAVRKRQRQEIQELREATSQLERELEMLKKKNRESPPPSTCSTSGNTDQDAGSARQYGNRIRLESSAARDNEAKEITELENIHLNKLVNDHMKVARQFEKVLRKHRPLTPSEIMETSAMSMLPYKVKSAHSYPGSVTDAPVFAMLERNVESRYHQLEQMFKAVGLTEHLVDVHEAQVDTSRDGGSFVKFKTSKVIPFEMHEINDAASCLSNNGSMMNLNGTSQIYKRTPTSVAFKKQFDIGSVTVSVRGMSKRFHEKDRTVIIWDGVGEWSSESSGQIVTIAEKGWGVIKPFPRSKASTSSSPPVSLLQSYTVMTPGSSLDATQQSEMQMPTQPEHVAMLSDVVLPSYQQLFKARMQLLENALLEQSLQRRQTASKDGLTHQSSHTKSGLSNNIGL